MNQQNQQKLSPLSEAMLWQLYRRLLGEEMVTRGLPASRRARTRGSAIAAAVTANLLAGDTLGIAPDDLATRYLCGVPLGALDQSIRPARGRRRSSAASWTLAADASHGLLPGNGAEQASLAAGTALSARLHQSGSVTVLLDRSLPSASWAAIESWAATVDLAVSLQLPLLFITGASVGPEPGPGRLPASMPSIPVDRSDPLAIYRVVYEAAARARTGGGPTWIECGVWAPPGAPRKAAASRALDTMEQALRARGFFNRLQQRHMQQALQREFAKAGWPVDGLE